MTCFILYPQIKLSLIVLALGYFTCFSFKKSTVFFRFN